MSVLCPIIGHVRFTRPYVLTVQAESDDREPVIVTVMCVPPDVAPDGVCALLRRFWLLGHVTVDYRELAAEIPRTFVLGSRTGSAREGRRSSDAGQVPQ